MTMHISPERLQQLVRTHLKSRKRRKELYSARREGTAPPAGSPHITILPNTEAHRILRVLSEQGPKTSNELGAGTNWGMQHTSAQILRLLDYGFIERDQSAVYSINDKGEEALTQLGAGVSHTRWLH